LSPYAIGNTKNVMDKLEMKSWAAADKPREKLLLHGRRYLTNAELMAILIRTGNLDENVVELSKRILSFCNNDLTKLSQLNVKDLSKFKGIGTTKAISIVAALELGRRRKDAINKKPQKISSSKDVDLVLRPDLEDLNHEEFWILLLNRANFVIGKQFISKGGQSGTVVDPKIIFKTALDQNAAAIILAHNHPSGNLMPSKADLIITKKLVEAGQVLELPVLDHLIITNQSFFSLADEGLMKGVKAEG
jgi:DNA repair protein RadC